MCWAARSRRSAITWLGRYDACTPPWRLTMSDSDEPRPELQQFLSDHAGALDREAAPIGAHEASNRVVARSLEPCRRWVRTPAAVAGHARRRPAAAAAAAVIAALLLGSVGGFAAGRSSAPDRAEVAARGSEQDAATTPTVIRAESSAAAA